MNIKNLLNKIGTLRSIWNLPSLAPKSVNTDLREYLLAAALTLVAFIFSLTMFFPSEVLEPRIEKALARQLGINIDLQGIGINLPFGLNVDNITVPLPNTNIDNLSEIVLTDVSINPAILSLFSAPYGTIEAAFAGGTLEASLAKDKTVSLTLAGIQMQKIVPQNPWAELDGTVGLTATIDRSKKNKGEFTLQGTAINLLGLDRFGLEKVHSLGDLIIKGEITGNRVRISDISTTDSEIEVKGQATVTLAKNPAASRIGAQLSLRPTEKMPVSTKELINLLGRKKDREGFYNIRISGTLAKPTIR